jgi:hypothetical protein
MKPVPSGMVGFAGSAGAAARTGVVNAWEIASVRLKAYVAMGDRLFRHYSWDKTSWDQACDVALEFWVDHAAQGLEMLLA